MDISEKEMKDFPEMCQQLRAVYTSWKDAGNLDRKLALSALFFLAAQEAVWEEMTKEVFSSMQSQVWDACKKLHEFCLDEATKKTTK